MSDHPYPHVELPWLLQDDKHRQGEGFRLMRYESKGGELEWIWNSRNAITPFGVTTRDRGEEMLHNRWPEDPYMPLHVPNVGDRIFVDLTLDMARAYRAVYVERWWNGGENLQPMSERWTTRAGAIEELAASDAAQYGGHSPAVVVVDAQLRAYFAGRALYIADNWPAELLRAPERLVVIGSAAAMRQRVEKLAGTIEKRDG